MYTAEMGFTEKGVPEFFDDHPEITPPMKIELLGLMMQNERGWGEDNYDFLERLFGVLCEQVENP